LQRFHPSRVLFTGVAGGIGHEVNIGDIIISDSVIQHDFGTLNRNDSIEYWAVANPISDQPNPVYYRADSSLISNAMRASASLQLAPVVIDGMRFVPKVKRGVIATGDLFISSASKKTQLYKQLHADAVEMEGAAVAQV
jgi:adenosylhomocysteine nucleosidase